MLTYKLTKSVVEKLATADDRFYVVQDSQQPKLQIRVNCDGSKSWLVYYRTKTGRRRWFKLGDWPDLSVEKAHEQADICLGKVAEGKDPAAEKKEKRDAGTFADFAIEYLKDMEKRRLAGQLADQTVAEARARINKILIPAWGREKLAAITEKDVTRVFKRYQEKQIIKYKKPKEGAKRKARGGVVAANRLLAQIKAMFSKAEEWGEIPRASSPAKYVKKTPEDEREIQLTPDELARLADAITAVESAGKATPWAAAALRLLMFTGARMSEILTLRWEYIDYESGCLKLPKSKTGKKVVFLNSATAEILAGLAKIKTAGHPFVIEGRIHGAHLVNLKEPWDRIRAKAELPTLRIHDLRHVYAGTGTALGLGLPIIGRLLGHTQAQTTLRYAKAANPVATAAAEAIGEALSAAMEKGRAKVVEIGAPAIKADTAKEASSKA